MHLSNVIWCVSSTTQYSPWGTVVAGGWPCGSLIIQGTWEIKSAESTQHPPLSFILVITSFYFFAFLFFLLAWQFLKVCLLIYSVSATCLHVSLSGTTHDQREKKLRWQTQDFLLHSTFFPHPQQIMFLQINQHLLVAGEARKRGWRIASLELISKRGLRGSCLGADYLQQPEFQPLEI